VIDPTAQLQAYAAATEDAVASGFAGFRVAAEVTALVRTPEQLDAFARYEHLVERYMLGHPFTAMCGYDRVELGSSRVAQLACLHPQVHPASATPFRLHATPGATAALAGEIDMTDRELLIEALDRAEVWSAGTGEVVLDARELTFIDHQSLRLLAEEAERRGAAVVLRTRLRTAARLVELLGLHRLRVEPAP
jgi:anti-anti-sigma factor